MKQYKTSPTNPDFFNEHGGSYQLYGLIGWLGQGLSFASLGYGIHSMVKDAVEVGTITLSTSLIMAGALTVAFIIEFANRALGRRAIKPFVDKNSFSGTDSGRHSILNNSYLGGLAVIAILSYILSAVGSVRYGEDSAPKLDLISIDSIHQVYAREIALVDSELIGDNAIYIQPFGVKIKQAEAMFQRDSLQAMQNHNRYEKCAKSGKDEAYCQKKQKQFLGLIDGYRRVRTDSINAIELEKAKTLAFLRNGRKGEIEEIEQKRDNALAKAELENQSIQGDAKSESSFRSMIFLILTVVGQSLFYYMTFLRLHIEAGSGITIEIKPDEFFLSPSVLSEWAATLSWKWGKRARNLVQYAFASEVSDPEIPYRTLEDNLSSSPGTAKATSPPPDWLPDWMHEGRTVYKGEQELLVSEVRIFPTRRVANILTNDNKVEFFDADEPHKNIGISPSPPSSYDSFFDEKNGKRVPSAEKKAVPL